MTNRFPLILDADSQRIRELASGDNLDLTGNGISAVRNIIPESTELYDLGSVDNKWRSLYLSGSTIYLGDGTISYTPESSQFAFYQNVEGTPVPAGVSLVSNNTDELSEGTTNLYFTTGRINNHLSGGTGVTYNNGQISIGQAVGTTSNVIFNNVTAALTGSVTGNVTGTLNGNADTATILATSHTIAMTGDVAYTSEAFDGSTNVTGTATLASVGVAGVYTKVTTDAKGRVTSGTILADTDIPNLDASKITSGTIDAARLPSYVDDVIEAANISAFPVTGETGKIYVAVDTNKTYRWSGSVYVYITSGAVDSVAGKTGVVTLDKNDVGLSNVDNTADSAKPVSTDQQTALNLKADLASPAFTGVPTAATANAGTSTTQVATTAFVAAVQVVAATDATTKADAAQAAAISAAATDASTKSATAKSEATTAAATDATTKANAAQSAAATDATTKVAAEATIARAAESALGVRIDNVLSNTDATALNSLTELVTAFQAADNNLTSSISSLSSSASSNLTAEITNRIAAISAEMDARVAGDDVLQGQISANATAIAAETTARIAAIADEYVNRVALDDVLQGQISTNATAITAEATARASAVTAAISTAATDATTKASAAQAAAISAAATDAATKANAAQAAAIGAAATDATTKANAAQAAAISAAATDATTKANAAQAAAISAAATDATTKVAAEATLRASGDTTNATAISNEVTRATAAEALLAPKASPTFTGVPAAPTAIAGTSTTQVATTAFVAAVQTVAATDATTKADAAQAAAISAAATDATTKANAAISTAATDATTKANAAINTAATDATTKANAAQAAAATDATTKANVAQAAAISAAASDATTKANAAQAAAIAAVTNGAGAAFDTLKEIQDAMATDTELAAAISAISNVASATKLQTARTIQGVAFDGTANITVATAGTGISVSGTTITNTINNTNQLTNGAGFVTSSGVTAVTATGPVVSSGGTTPVISIPAATASVDGHMTAAYANKLNGIAAGATNVTNTNQLTNGAGFITGITSGNVTTALGFTPYNSTNPSGFITSSDSILGNAATATKLQTARNIALSGAITGNADFDGSGNISITTTSAGGGSAFTLNNTIIYSSLSCTGGTGWKSFLFGPNAGNNTMTGRYNNFIGAYAGGANTTGCGNNFIGAYTGRSNTTGCGNNFIGYFNGQYNTSGLNNNFMGTHAGRCSTGSNNNFFGIRAGCRNQANHNNFLGQDTGCWNSTGGDNNFFGFCAGNKNTTGARNTFIGPIAGFSNTTGNNNVFLGNAAGWGNTTGGQNNFIGMSAGCCNTTGAYNNLIGFNAGKWLKTGSHNNFIGYYAGFSSSIGTTNTGSCNSFFGTRAGQWMESGCFNTFLGVGAGCSVTTGSNNIVVGCYAGSSAAGPSMIALTTQSNTIVMGNNAHTCAIIKIGWSTTSDCRDKYIFGSVPHGRGFLQNLKTIEYAFKDRETGCVTDLEGKRRYGFSAQNVLEAEGESPVIVSVENPEQLQFTSDYIIPVLVNAVNELSAEIDLLKTRLEALEPKVT